MAYARQTVLCISRTHTKPKKVSNGKTKNGKSVKRVARRKK